LLNQSDHLLTYILNIVSYSQISTKGKDFWVGFIRNNGNISTAIYISSDKNTSGTVEIPLTGWSESFTDTADSTIKIGLSYYAVTNDNGDVITNNAVHITADNDVSAYAANLSMSSSDATVLIPTKSLSNEYLATTHLEQASEPSIITVVASEDIDVEITPSSDCIGGYTKGVPFIKSLLRGQVYVLKAQKTD
jgi:hypothetical protein